MALLCTRYVTITDHLLCGCWCYETASYYTTLRHVVNGVINLANPRNPQPQYMYFVCERPISMAVERWTNLSMSQQPPWTSDFDHLDDLDTLITLSTLSSQCSVRHLFSVPGLFRGRRHTATSRQKSQGGMERRSVEHTSSGFYCRSSLYLAILAYFRLLAYSHCTCALPRRGISV